MSDCVRHGSEVVHGSKTHVMVCAEIREHGGDVVGHRIFLFGTEARIVGRGLLAGSVPGRSICREGVLRLQAPACQSAKTQTGVRSAPGPEQVEWQAALVSLPEPRSQWRSLLRTIKQLCTTRKRWMRYVYRNERASVPHGRVHSDATGVNIDERQTNKDSRRNTHQRHVREKRRF